MIVDWLSELDPSIILISWFTKIWVIFEMFMLQEPLSSGVLLSFEPSSVISRLLSFEQQSGGVLLQQERFKTRIQ
ncbi:hypothetical protein V6N12_070624 [Hibiscus sabdariffa]|uniref:Uncharacterized protein n=1 Tax=Hibiscus sabdariffa TaxID=183260 RepID=A0ABR2FHE0_9ROSI